MMITLLGDILEFAGFWNDIRKFYEYIISTSFF